MTVKELKEIISKYPDHMLLVMSADEEGNSFSTLYEVGESMYLADGNYGETYVMDKYIGTQGYTEEDRAPEGAIHVLVLWP